MAGKITGGPKVESTKTLENFGNVISLLTLIDYQRYFLQSQVMIDSCVTLISLWKNFAVANRLFHGTFGLMRV